jgi:hypothetical protein
VRRLDLNDYSNREILNALFELSADRFIVLIQALGDVITELNTKGNRIAREQDKQVDSVIRRVLNRR